MTDQPFSIDIPAIPEKWQRILSEVRIVFPEAVIGGGCLRDLILEKEHKDIDVFVPWRTSEDLSQTAALLYSRMGDLPYDSRALSELKVYAMNFSDVVQVFGLRIEREDVQIIALDAPVSSEYIASRCDFGICRLAWDGECLNIREDFLTDVKNKTFTLLRCSDVESHWRRWLRLKERFPGWTLVAPEIREWLEASGMDPNEADFDFT